MRPLPAGKEDEEPLALRARLWTRSIELSICSLRRPDICRGVARWALVEIAGASCHCLVAQLGSHQFRPLLDVPRKRGIA